jgi:hypothetical protein
VKVPLVEVPAMGESVHSLAGLEKVAARLA